jgi:hypothetical protein
MKTCTRCHLEKPLEAFYRDKRASDGRYAMCKPCADRNTERWRSENADRDHATRRRWRTANADRLAVIKKRSAAAHPYNAWLKHRYGITLEGYHRLLQEQGGGCAICGAAENGLKKNKMLCVDHDHASGAVRGLLCDRCNKAIGYLNDDPALVGRALAYLQATNKRDALAQDESIK